MSGLLTAALLSVTVSVVTPNESMLWFAVMPHAPVPIKLLLSPPAPPTGVELSVAKDWKNPGALTLSVIRERSQSG